MDLDAWNYLVPSSESAFRCAAALAIGYVILELFFNNVLVRIYLRNPDLR